VRDAHDAHRDRVVGDVDAAEVAALGQRVGSARLRHLGEHVELVAGDGAGAGSRFLEVDAEVVQAAQDLRVAAQQPDDEQGEQREDDGLDREQEAGQRGPPSRDAALSSASEV
jgi:hypothetical protein